MPGPEGERNRRAERQLCAKDVLHFTRYWLWLYSPWAPPDKQEFPYIPYEFQEELILYLRGCIVRCNDPNTFECENTVIEKARYMAGSWTIYDVVLHDFLFYNGSYLVLSWKREEVDEPGNMDTPFEKLRFMIRRLPEWLLPPGWNWREHSNVGLLKNPAGASIGSESMIGAAGAGGRVRGAIFDELGKVTDGVDFPAWRSMSGTTRWRLACSTPEGKDNKFGRLARGEEDEARVLISLNWWKDPIKAQGFKIVNGKPTSPWYEEQKRKNDPITQASQVDISYDMSVGGGVFSSQYSLWHRVKDTELQPVPGKRIVVTLDLGVHAFVSFTQFDSWERYLILDEHYDPNTSIDNFVDAIQRIQRNRFRDFQFDYIGDPAGGTVNSTLHRLKSEYLYLLQTYGWHIDYNFQGSNRANWVPQRIEALRRYLTRVCPQLSQETGPAPMVLIDTRRCKHIHEALAGGYRYEADQAGIISNRIKAGHPHEDAADTVTYPLIWKGLYMHREDRKEHPRRGATLNWHDVGSIGYG